MKAYKLEGRKREERVGELRNVACHKRGLTNWGGGRGRSGLVSSKTWQVINEDSPTGGEEEGGGGWGALNLGMWQVRNEELEGRGGGEGGGEQGNGGFEKRRRTNGRGGAGRRGSAEI